MKDQTHPKDVLYAIYTAAYAFKAFKQHGRGVALVKGQELLYIPIKNLPSNFEEIEAVETYNPEKEYCVFLLENNGKYMFQVFEALKEGLKPVVASTILQPHIEVIEYPFIS